MDEYIRRGSAIEQFEDSTSAIPEKLARIRIKEIPAVDVVEVRHGRWIKDGEDGPVYCSECGEEHEWEDYRASYCDTCGAKMDGGQEE